MCPSGTSGRSSEESAAKTLDKLEVMGYIPAAGGGVTCTPQEEEVVTGFFVFLVALACSLIVTPLARALGLRLGVLDSPGALSIHAHPIARTGGVAMFVGFLAAMGYALAAGLAGGDDRTLVGVLVGGGFIASAGFLDDLKRISPLQKAVWQLLAAFVVIGFGLQVKTFPLAGVGIVLTLFCLVGGANALNLLDGMDGLAAGTAAIAAVFLAVLAAGQGNGPALVLASAILGATLGFLPYNWGISNLRERGPQSLSAVPAQAGAIFMGDSGSFFLGFTLSSIAILFASQPNDLVGFITPFVVISIPILDTALAIWRRLIRRADPFGGDRQHVYDLLAKAGLGNRGAVLVIYLATALLGSLSLILVRLTTWPAMLLAAGAIMIMGLIAVRLGALESDRARESG